MHPPPPHPPHSLILKTHLHGFLNTAYTMYTELKPHFMPSCMPIGFVIAAGVCLPLFFLQLATPFWSFKFREHLFHLILAIATRFQYFAIATCLVHLTPGHLALSCSGFWARLKNVNLCAEVSSSLIIQHWGGMSV